MSTQVNFHVQLSTLRHLKSVDSDLEKALREAMEKAIRDLLCYPDNPFFWAVTIRGPEVVSLF